MTMSGLSVVVVGDSQCGKTQLINRFANGAFDQVNMRMVVVVVMMLVVVMMMIVVVMMNDDADGDDDDGGEHDDGGGGVRLQVWQGSLDQQIFDQVGGNIMEESSCFIYEYILT